MARARRRDVSGQAGRQAGGYIDRCAALRCCDGSDTLDGQDHISHSTMRANFGVISRGRTTRLHNIIVTGGDGFFVS